MRNALKMLCCSSEEAVVEALQLDVEEIIREIPLTCMQYGVIVASDFTDTGPENPIINLIVEMEVDTEVAYFKSVDKTVLIVYKDDACAGW